MVVITPAFRKTVTEIFQQTGEGWLSQLPDLINEIEAAWSLRVLDPFSLSINYVAPAILEDGQQAVLKLSVPVGEFFTELAALQAYDGHGMARLLLYDAEKGVMLLERLTPGQMLSEITDDEAATRIAAQVFRDLWRPAPAEHAFPTVAKWAKGFERMRKMFDGGSGPLPANLADRAEALFTELLQDESDPVLLHGDLHHFNILSAENGSSWKAIDPKGIVGEAMFEVSAFMLNPFLEMRPPEEFHHIFDRRYAIFSEMLGFDRQRMAAWCAARAVLANWWTVEDHGSLNALDFAIMEGLMDMV